MAVKNEWRYTSAPTLRLHGFDRTNWQIIEREQIAGFIPH
jgi:hypothetical protein